MAKWNKIMDCSFYMKTHVVPNNLTSDVVNSLRTRAERKGREFNPVIELITNSITLEMPGLLYQSRNEHKIALNNLTIRIPSVDVECIIARLRRLNKRNEIGIDYYKLHTHLICLCLTPEMREQLHSEFVDILPEALLIADKEYRRDKSLTPLQAEGACKSKFLGNT
jgi:hypothetical protein